MRQYWKNVLRISVKNIGSLIGAALIIGLGIAVFIGMLDSTLSTQEDLDHFIGDTASADVYVRLTSISRDAAQKLTEIEGIQTVNGKLHEDLRVMNDSDTITTLGLFSYDENDTIDTFVFSDKTPQGDQICIGPEMQKYYQFEIGDPIDLAVNGRTERFYFCGTASSPSMCEMIAPGANAVNGRTYDLAVVSRQKLEALLGRADTYSYLYIRLLPGYSFEDVEIPLSNYLESYGLQSIAKRTEEEQIKSVLDSLQMTQGASVIFPVIFLAVAVFMLYIVMKKLVDRDQTLIGAMKAFGMTDQELLGAYLIQGAAIGVVGAAAGILLSSPVGFYVYSENQSYYNFPNAQYRCYWYLLVIGFLLSVATGIIASYVSCRGILKITPAHAMKTMPPKDGLRIRLPGFIEKRTGLLGKIAVRGMTANPANVAVIALSVAIGVSVGSVCLSIPPKLNHSVEKYYEEFAVYDLQAGLKESVDSEEAKNAVLSLEGVTQVSAAAEYSMKLYSGSRSLYSSAMILNEEHPLIVPVDYYNEMKEPAEDGIILNYYTAQKLGIRKGDEIEISVPELGGHRVKTMVRDIIVMDYGTLSFMSAQAFRDYFGSSPGANVIYIRTEKGREADVYNRLKDGRNILSVTYETEDRARSEEEFETIYLIGVILGVFALASCAAVAYNISMINFRERLTQMGTMLVMGRTERDLGIMCSVELAVTAAAGILLGILLIRPAARIITDLLSTDYTYAEIYPDTSMTLAVTMLIVLVMVYTWYKEYRMICGIRLTDILKERN